MERDACLRNVTQTLKSNISDRLSLISQSGEYLADFVFSDKMEVELFDHKFHYVHRLQLERLAVLGFI